MIRIGVAQLNGSGNSLKNLKTCAEIVSAASERNVEAVFFPEASDWIGRQGSKDDSQSFLNGLQQLSKKNDIWIFAGIHEPYTNSTKYFNSHVAINNEGNIVQTYRKIHLFDYPQANLMESKSTSPGIKLEYPVKLCGFKCGLAVCYDIRFPELSHRLVDLGASILTFPSAFTVQTGRKHWEILAKARAIDNQSYVVAAAQVGDHQDSMRSSWGESLIIGPDGNVLVMCSSYDGNLGYGNVVKKQDFELGIADVSLSEVERVRKEMPLGLHRVARVWCSDETNKNSASLC